MGSTMEEYKEDSNMITFEVTENMLAKVSHDFWADNLYNIDYIRISNSSKSRDHQ